MKTQTIFVPKDEMDSMQRLLDGKDREWGEHTIQTYTANFGNGVEADIKVCGVQESIEPNDQPNPYVDPVLFDNGSEVCVGEVGDELEGEYLFEYDNEEYQVLVKYTKY